MGARAGLAQPSPCFFPRTVPHEYSTFTPCNVVVHHPYRAYAHIPRIHHFFVLYLFYFCVPYRFPYGLLWGTCCLLTVYVGLACGIRVAYNKTVVAFTTYCLCSTLSFSVLYGLLLYTFIMRGYTFLLLLQQGACSGFRRLSTGVARATLLPFLFTSFVFLVLKSFALLLHT